MHTINNDDTPQDNINFDDFESIDDFEGSENLEPVDNWEEEFSDSFFDSFDNFGD